MIFFMKTKICLIFLSMFLMMGCNSLDKVRDSRWKYVEGYHIGDLLDFTLIKQFKLDDNGNLYVEDELMGKIVNYSNTQLAIESNEGEKGFYTVLD